MRTISAISISGSFDATASRADYVARSSNSSPRRIAYWIVCGVIPCSALYARCFVRRRSVSSMAFCIAIAVRDMRMTLDEAIAAATIGGAKALRRADVGRITAGSRADLVVLDAPSYTHLVYRPGVPLVRSVIEAGVLVA
jgi:imidazolonepropionase